MSSTGTIADPQSTVLVTTSEGQPSTVYPMSSSIIFPSSSSSGTDQSAPTPSHSKASSHGVPEIDGSPGGFIGLVVALCLIIIISSTAVFFLLRHREPSKQERDARRQRSHHYQRRADALSSSSPFNYAANSPDSPPSWRNKIGGIFSFGSKGKRTRVGSGNRGWVQAGSGDDWEIYSEDEEQGGARGGQQLQEVGRGISISKSSMSRGAGSTEPPSHSDSYQQSDSTSSVGLDLYAPGQTYDDPFKSPTQPTDPSSDIHTSPRVADAPRSASPEPLQESVANSRDAPPHEGKHFSTQSGASMRTFEGGTKFIESL